MTEMTIENPVEKTETPAFLSKDELSQIKKSIESSLTDRTQWEDKLRCNYNAKYGRREAKTFPWPGCSNIHIPLTDTHLRDSKPMFFNAIFRQSPICDFNTVGLEDPQKARDVGLIYDHVVRIRMGNAAEKSIARVIDSMNTYGFGLMKCYWKHKEERVTRTVDFSDITKEERDAILEASDDQLIAVAQSQFGLDPTSKDDLAAMREAKRQLAAGNEQVTVSFLRIVYSAPYWEHVHPIDVFVPWDAKDDIDSLPWIAHRWHISEADLLEGANSGLYNKESVKEILMKRNDNDTDYQQYISGSDGNFRQTQYSREQITERKGKKSYIEAYEYFCMKDVNGDGLLERIVVNIDIDTGAILNQRELPYDHGQWPFIKFNFEEAEDRWYSPRGIPELLEDLQQEINAQHNMWVDRQTIVNAAQWKYRENSGIDPDLVRVQPGRGIPVQRMDDVEPMNHQVLDFSFDNAERVLTAWADRYTGSAKNVFSNVQNRVERRTAAEVNAFQQDSAQIAELDVRLFQGSMRRLHDQTRKLWAQYGDPRTEIRVAGKTVRVNRADLDGSYDVVPAGDLTNSSTEIQMGKVERMIGMASSPVAGAYANIADLMKKYFEIADPRNADRYYRPPGAFEENAEQEQAAEIVIMLATAQIPPVDIGENHQAHVAVLTQAIPTWQQRDEGVAELLGVHLAMHSIAAGQMSPEDPSLQNLRFQIIQQGNRLFAVPKDQAPPVVPPEQGVAR